jgi:hypothetical protein
MLRMLTSLRNKAEAWCSILSLLLLGIHHVQKTSVHPWSTQPLTIQHQTAASRHSYLNYKRFEHKLSNINGHINWKPDKIDSQLEINMNDYPWLRIGCTVKKADGDKYCAAAVAVLETLTRLISNAFSLAIYTTFSHPDPSLKPCGCCTCLIIKQSKHFPFSPNLYTTALTVLRNDLRNLRKWRTCKLAFPSAGWRCRGWVYKKQYQINTKWLWLKTNGITMQYSGSLVMQLGAA